MPSDVLPVDSQPATVVYCNWCVRCQVCLLMYYLWTVNLPLLFPAYVLRVCLVTFHVSVICLKTTVLRMCLIKAWSCSHVHGRCYILYHLVLTALQMKDCCRRLSMLPAGYCAGKWAEDATLLLMALYEDVKQKFGDRRIKKKYVWEQHAETRTQLHRHRVTDCYKKCSNLEIRYEWP